MEKPMIFALTPRAGKWNHRYLVPTGASRRWSQKELSRLAEAAAESSEGPDYLAVRRDVTQLTTGRTGTELIVLAGVGSTQQDAETQDNLKKELRACQDELNDLMTQRDDWDSIGRHLVVEFPELDRWQREIGKQTSAGRPVEQNDKPAAGSTMQRVFGITALVVIFAFVLIGVYSHYQVGGWQPDALQQITQHGNNQNLTRDERRMLDKLAGIIGISSEVVSDEDLRREVADELATSLFQPATNDESPGSSDKSTAVTDSADDTLTETLRDFYQVLFKKETHDTWSDILRDQSVTANLKALYDDPGNLDPCALIKEQYSDITEELKEIVPVQFREIVVRLQQLKEALGESDVIRRPEGSIYEEFFHRLYTQDKGSVKLRPELRALRPQFYVEDDIKAAEQLNGLLKEKKTQKLLETSDRKSSESDSLSRNRTESNNEETGLVDQLRAVSSAYHDRSSNLSRDEIRDEKEDYRREAVKEVFRRFEEFVKACAEAASAEDT